MEERRQVRHFLLLHDSMILFLAWVAQLIILGVAYWTAFYPADTVGSQIRANPLYAKRGFVSVFLDILKAEGWKGLYRGWAITAARAAPAHALIFAMYEKTIDLFRRFDPQTQDSIDKRSGSISHSS